MRIAWRCRAGGWACAVDQPGEAGIRTMPTPSCRLKRRAHVGPRQVWESVLDKSWHWKGLCCEGEAVRGCKGQARPAKRVRKPTSGAPHEFPGPGHTLDAQSRVVGLADALACSARPRPGDGRPKNGTNINKGWGRLAPVGQPRGGRAPGPQQWRRDCSAQVGADTAHRAVWHMGWSGMAKAIIACMQ
jgi:hypothetical protein